MSIWPALSSLTEGEFLRFSERYRHKKAAQLLQAYQENREEHLLTQYRRIEGWMGFAPLDPTDFSAFSDRYHHHLTKAGLSWKEHHLLSSPFLRTDQASTAPFLPVAIYLDNLRSAFNVGSILRTVEAFRLGKVYFSQTTPFIDNPKVQKTSMFTYDKVPCIQVTDLLELPRPLIALETDPEAPSLFDFAFPPAFTLLLGNEEYGLSKEALAQRDHLLQIPLFGFKNSLNVASAFAIAAGVVSHQLRK